MEALYITIAIYSATVLATGMGIWLYLRKRRVRRATPKNPASSKVVPRFTSQIRSEVLQLAEEGSTLDRIAELIQRPVADVELALKLSDLAKKPPSSNQEMMRFRTA